MYIVSQYNQMFQPDIGSSTNAYYKSSARPYRVAQLDPPPWLGPETKEGSARDNHCIV